MARHPKPKTALASIDDAATSVARWIKIGGAIFSGVAGVVSAIFFAGYHYSNAEQEVHRFKSRLEQLETNFASLSRRHDLASIMQA